MDRKESRCVFVPLPVVFRNLVFRSLLMCGKRDATGSLQAHIGISRQRFTPMVPFFLLLCAILVLLRSRILLQPRTLLQLHMLLRKCFHLQLVMQWCYCQPLFMWVILIPCPNPLDPALLQCMLVRRQASPLQNVMIEIVLVHQTTIKTYSVFQVLICVFTMCLKKLS